MAKPNLIESYEPCSGSYSWKKDLRLNLWLGVTTVLYCVILWLVKKHPEWSPLTRGVFSLLPLVPALLYVGSWMRLIRGMDEMQRRIQLEGFLFGAVGTVFIGVIFSTLNANGVLPLGAMQSHGLGLGGAFVAMFALWLVGTALANKRYR